MQSKSIHSENPLEHWSDVVDVRDKVVLDLGCGWLFQPFMSTPEYFLSREAKKVIGVDASCGEIEQLKQTFPVHTFICRTIEKVEDITSLLEEYRPELVKMDIEGHEVLMEQITDEQLSSVKEFAIEYHNPTCKQVIIKRLTELGFEIFAINPFGWFVTDPEVMGVLHAKR
jgi:hypothetical protein